MPSLHSLSCKILNRLRAYYSRAQAGPAHGCLAVAIMFRNQLTIEEEKIISPRNYLYMKLSIEVVSLKSYL